MLIGIEYVMDIGVANANRHMLYPHISDTPLQNPSDEVLTEHFRVAWLRARRLQALTRVQPFAPLVQQPQAGCPPLDTFMRFLAGFPHNWPALLLAVHKYAIAQYLSVHSTARATTFSALSNAHVLQPVHHLSDLPDHRAQQLTQSNHLLLVAIRELSKAYFVVCAQIGASWKATCYGVVLRIAYLEDSQIAFDAECSCLQGYLITCSYSLINCAFQLKPSMFAHPVSVALP
jgi:hypothetical protein